MNLSKEMAVRLHRMMWSDMQKELGNDPLEGVRLKFKKDWIERNFPDALVMHNCFLCEYSFHQTGRCCSNCPIKWPEGHCNGTKFSYATAPISDILALPARSEESTLMKAYVEKSFNHAYLETKQKIAKASGLDGFCTVDEHIKAIQEKAVEDYFEKTPGAKLASMDVDKAFKQYADEQKAPIFHALAEASGLSAGYESVKAHIYEIKRLAKNSGRIEKAAEIFDELSEASGLLKGNWSIPDHVKAIQERAKEQMDPYVKSCTLLVDTLNKYKDFLSDESGLDRNRPVEDHIKEIWDDAFSDGRDYERERIMDKIGEMLNDKSAGTAKDS